MARASRMILVAAGAALTLTAFGIPQVGRGVASLAGALVPAPAQAETGRSASKSNRIEPPRPAATVATPAVVEIVGLGPAAVILRDKAGNVLYRTDVAANTTTVAKDADLPVITVKERADSPVVKRPAPSLGAGEGRGLKTGCEGLVSSLVAHEVRRIPSRCTAEAPSAVPGRIHLAMN